MELRSGKTAADPPESERDFRVRCHNKQLMTEVIEMCSDFSKSLLESQPELNQEQRDRALEEASRNFERAVQENITVNGDAWQEASASESGLESLEDQLDEATIATSFRRQYYPRKALPHLLKTLKTEREMLELYQPVANPEQLRFDTNQLSRMATVTAKTSSMVKQLKESMKYVTDLVEKTEGLSQVLNLHPTLQRSKIHKEVFSQNPSEENEKSIDAAVSDDLDMTPSETEVPDEMEMNQKRKRLQSPEKRSPSDSFKEENDPYLTKQ